MIRLIKTLLVVWMICGSMALQAAPLRCTGTVTDSNGTPIASAQVSLHVMTLAQGSASANYEVTHLQETSTDEAGRFSLEVEPSAELGYRVGVILVDHAPLALGWDNWQLHEDTQVDVVLSEPTSIAGGVVDEDGDPIAETQVELFMLMIPDIEPRYLTGMVCPKLLTGQTDTQGRFQFNRIPSEATAEFLVKQEGRATVLTFSVRQGTALNYRAGQEDIRIVQPIEATIQGQVVDKRTGQGISRIQLQFNPSKGTSLSGRLPIFSKSDGSFVITGLSAGHYLIKPIFNSQQSERWADTSVPMEVKKGQALVDVKVELSQGGLLEVMITTSTNAPLEKASVSIRDMATNQWLHAKSDETGLARIRLTPGQYLINSVNKPGYRSQSVSTEITIEEGQTMKQAWQLGSQPTIAGMVTDPDGVPLEGVKLRIMPMGNQDVTSDAEGHFTVTWDPSRWGPEETTFCLVARHEGRELGLVVPIDEDQSEAALKLQPAISVSGKIVDQDGRPIAQSQARVMLRVSNWRSTLSGATAKADDQGRFTIKTLPPDQDYYIKTLADGYGQADKSTSSDGGDKAIDLGTFELPLADQSISGTVVDINDKPVANARIYAYGDGQPDQHDIKTDDEGKFVIEQVCAGRIRLHVNYYEPGQPQMHGSIQSEGGASDVIITVSPQGSNQGFAPRSPKSLIGKTLPDLKSLSETLADLELADQSVLLCFWDMQQRPARRCLMQLAKQAESLKQQGVTVIAIQGSPVEADTLNDWMQRQKIPFTSTMLAGDVDKTKFAWGVKALPWLILTNKNHQVIAEGFPLRKLKENLAKVENSVEEPKEMPR